MWIKNSIDTKRTNPWCGLLKPDLEKWHFFYKIDDVKEEVFKRTSYIGRFRKADEKSDGNLTDVLSLSPDEHDMLVPFMKSAMADVFDTLIKFTNTDDNAYSYDENAETKKVDSLEFKFSNSYIRYEGGLVKKILPNESFSLSGSLSYANQAHLLVSGKGRYRVSVHSDSGDTVFSLFKRTQVGAQEDKLLFQHWVVLTDVELGSNEALYLIPVKWESKNNFPSSQTEYAYYFSLIELDEPRVSGYWNNNTPANSYKMFFRGGSESYYELACNMCGGKGDYVFESLSFTNNSDVNGNYNITIFKRDINGVDTVISDNMHLGKIEFSLEDDESAYIMAGSWADRNKTGDDVIQCYYNLIKIAKNEENPIRSHFHLVTGKSNDYILQLKLRVKYNTRYMAGSSCFEENKEAVCDIELNDSNYLDNGVLSGYQFEVVFDADLKPGDGNLSDDEFVGITGVDILSMRVFEKNPAKLHAGDWVEYSGVDGEITLYKVLKDCDTNHEISDTSFFEKQDYDYRGSIHYVIRKPSLLNNNAMKAVDSGIYEALVNLCLSKWFNVSYPDEAGRYYNIYLGEMEKVRMRLQQDIYRHRIIPRAY